MIVEFMIGACIVVLAAMSFLAGRGHAEHTKQLEECLENEKNRNEGVRRRSVANLAKIVCSMEALCAKEAIADNDWSGIVDHIPDWVSLALVDKHTFMSSNWADLPGNDAQAERQAKLRRVIRVQIKVVEAAIDKLVREAAL